MALNIGESFLDDAEESGFDGLRQAIESGQDEKLGIDAAAVGETLRVFLEGGDEAEIIEERRVEEVRESTDFAGDLLREVAGFFEGAKGGFVAGADGLTSLGEAKVDSENGLREAVVEFAAKAAAFFVLELEEMGSKAMDSAFSVFHLSDVRKSADDASDIAAGVQLGDDIAKNPNNPFGGTRITKAEDAVLDGGTVAEHSDDGVVCGRNVDAVFGDGNDTVVTGKFSSGGAFGDAKHTVGSGVGVLDAAVRAVKDNGNMKVADESAEAFLAIAKSIRGATLLGEIGKGHDDAGEFTGRGEFGDGVEEGPKNVGPARNAPANEAIALGKASGDGSGNGAKLERNRSAVLIDRDEVEVDGSLADGPIKGDSEKLDDGSIGVDDAGIAVVGNNADVKILDE